MTLSVYRWEDIHRYFPQEVIEQYRKKIIEEWKSGKFKDREIWERYGMSENAFYDLINRYSEEENLKDKSSKPKNPSHKLGQEEIQKIINKAREDRNKIKAMQSAFETDMKKDGDIAAKNLEILKQIKPQGQKIEIRLDCGKEFYKESVKNFCNKNNIRLRFIPKGSPWLQAFIERGFRTIKEEFLS